MMTLRRELEEENRKLRKLVKLKNELLVCYRIGKNPTEGFWKAYEKVRELDESIKKE